MIGDLLFFIKSVILSLVFIILLQVKIGDLTIEEKTVAWARESAVIQPIEDVARGGVIALREGWQSLYSLFSGQVKDVLQSDEAPGRRSLGIKLERSKKYLKEKALKAKEIAQEKAEEAKRLAAQKMEETSDEAKEKAHQTSDELLEELKKEGFLTEESD